MMNIPDGDYKARAMGADLTYTMNGKERVTVTFELLDEPKGHIQWHGYLSDKAIESTVKAMRRLGWKGNDVSNFDGVEGTEVSIAIEAEEYKGKVYPKVKAIGAARLDPRTAKALGASLASRIAAVSDEQAAPHDDVPPPDDEIGF